MFETGVDGLAGMTGQPLAALIEANNRELVERENNVLLLAVAWADLHDRTPGEYSPLIDRSTAFGGQGTPELSEFCAAEFGVLQGLSMSSARMLIADALDLRHRLPRLWDRVKAGTVRAWKARKVAEATRFLSYDAAGDVDHAVARSIEQVSWPRFQRILGAAMYDADPVAMAERDERARTERMVRATDSESGLRTIIIRATSGDTALFMATVSRIAEILKIDGDTDTIDVRRSKAAGIIANPARALALLMRHRHDPTDLAEPDDTDYAPMDPESDPPAEGLFPDESSLPDERAPGDHGAREPAGARPAEHDPTGSDQATSDESEERQSSSEQADHQQPGDQRNDHAQSNDDQTDREHCTHCGHPNEHGGLNLNIPAAFDAAAVRPRAVLYFHLTDLTLRDGHGIVRPEHGTMISLNHLREQLTDLGCYVKIQPIVDPTETAPIDGYETSQRLREMVRLRNPAEVFPYGTCLTRTMDYDHTIPYQEGGPPGQTSMANLGPLSRGAHRAATLGRFRKRQPDPGTYAWRTPHGRVFLVTNQGTLNLGNTAFAQEIWRAAVQAGATITPAMPKPDAA